MTSSHPSPPIPDRPLKVGTRGSPLALWQAEHIASQLVQRDPRLHVEIVAIRTAGEKYAEWDFREIGVGVFTREIDQALLEGRVDFAVHSLKDLPTDLPEKLILAAVPERESPFDAWISGTGTPLEKLPPGARIGTSSPRRQAQILHRRRDLEVVPLRGNVETRLRKIGELGLAGTILAYAGLHRLGKDRCITALVPADWILPAVGQGALAVVARQDRLEVVERLQAIEHRPSRRRVAAERAFLKALRGGCQVPAAALATLDGAGRTLRLEGMVATADGAKLLRDAVEGPSEECERLGLELAQSLLQRGGDRILEQIREGGGQKAGGGL
ncbi:MAG: hydroxymethylbilane synthase [Planctomycetes bacterium]|nr:hydroxymethylbilane synthase [Planctomycetota bacterium]